MHQHWMNSSLWLASCPAGNGGQSAQKCCKQDNRAVDRYNVLSREVGNLHDHRNRLRDGPYESIRVHTRTIRVHSDHTSTNILVSANTKIANVHNMVVCRQRRGNIMIGHMNRSPVDKDMFKLFIRRSWFNINTAKIKTIEVISHLVGGSGKLNAIFMVRQRLNSRDPLCTNGLNQSHPNILNGLLTNQPLGEAKTRSGCVPPCKILRGEVRAGHVANIYSMCK